MHVPNIWFAAADAVCDDAPLMLARWRCQTVLLACTRS